MSVVIQVDDPTAEKIKDITGEISDDKAIHAALERFVRDYEVTPKTNGSTEADSHDLPDEYWDDLFSMPMIPSSVIDEALRRERE